MQIFTDALYRDYKPDALERYDQALAKGRESGESTQISGELFQDVLKMIDENRREFRSSDETEQQKLDDGNPYQDESMEYTMQEQYNYKYEVKPQAVQQEILHSTLESSDFSPQVTSSNNQGQGGEADQTSVVVEDDSQAGNDGFSFGEVEASIVAERAPSAADTMLGEIAYSQQAVPQGNPASDPTLPDESVTKI